MAPSQVAAPFSSLQRKGARYYVVVEEGPGHDGKRRRSWHSGYKTRKEAEDALVTILSEIKGDTYSPPTKVTVANFLKQTWLPSIRKNVGPNTASLYRVIVGAYIIPRIGGIEVQRLRPAHLDTLYEDLLAGGGRRGKPLSPKSVTNVHTTMFKAMSDAVRLGRISRNPAELASPPRSTGREMSTWTAERVAELLAHVRDDRLYAAWLTLVTTGLRRGELLGLAWKDVNFTDARLSIRRSLVLVGGVPQVLQPKTKRSRRTVPIPDETVAALKAHRAAQLQERLALGPGYSDGDLVFAREDGTALHPDTFSEHFQRHAKAAELPPIRVHDLRHTFATLALEAGIPAKVVSVNLGHAGVGITLDTYSHIVPGCRRRRRRGSLP
jgi:integrase